MDNFNKYEETKVKITSLHEKNSESTGYNVRISNINSKLTNDSYKIKNREKGWTFLNSELKNTSKNESSVELILPPAKNIEIEFVKTKDSGKVLLEYNGLKKKIDLYNKNWDDNLFGEQVMTYKLKSRINKIRSPSSIAIFSLYSCGEYNPY